MKVSLACTSSKIRAVTQWIVELTNLCRSDSHARGVSRRGGLQELHALSHASSSFTYLLHAGRGVNEDAWCTATISFSLFWLTVIELSAHPGPSKSSPLLLYCLRDSLKLLLQRQDIQRMQTLLPESEKHGPEGSTPLFCLNNISL